MVVISVTYKPDEETALQKILDGLRGSFVFRMPGSIDQIASQMGMPCFRCGGTVVWNKERSPNDELFMMYTLREQDVTIESIPIVIGGGFHNIRISKDIKRLCETMRSMCSDCKNVANIIGDVQVLGHRSLSDKAESETPSSSRGSHTPIAEPNEQIAKVININKPEKKKMNGSANEGPVKKMPKLELPNSLDAFEELQAQTIRSMLLAKHMEMQKEPEAADSPSTSGSPINGTEDHHEENGTTDLNISLRDIKREAIFEDSLKTNLEAVLTADEACASNDTGVEVMNINAFESFNDSDYPTATAEICSGEIDITSQFDIDCRDFLLGLSGALNSVGMVPRKAPRRSAPAISSAKSLSSTFDNIVTKVHYEWQQAQCKKCRKTLKVKDGAGWKNRIKVTAMSHVRKHMTIEPFFCEVCLWGCNHFPSIVKHMMANHPADRDRFQDRTTHDSFIEEASKVLYDCFDCIPPKIN